MTEPDPRLDALASWFAAEQLHLVRFATIVCGDAHAAEDLVQDAFVRAYVAGARVQAEFGTYARRAILNLGRSRFRRAAAERRALTKIGTPDDRYLPDERDDAIWSALLRLSVQQRAVLGLRDFEDLSERDIALTLGISTGGVKRHAHRGMERLRQLLGDEPR